jgi:hypothetical protein
VSDSAEQELEQFLAALHPALRKWLEKGAGALASEEHIEAAKALNLEAPDLRFEYARLLLPFPDKLREYNKRFKQEQAQGVRELFPLLAIPEGRPRKNALADEAAQLKESGLSYAQVAFRLNQKYGDGTATAESVRKLINNRKRRFAHSAISSPDKTQK